MPGNKVPITKAIFFAIISLVLCIPVSGFIWGFLNCSVSSLNMWHRLFFGLTSMVAVTAALGRHVESDEPFVSLRTTEIVVFIVLNALFYINNKRKLK